MRETVKTLTRNKKRSKHRGIKLYSNETIRAMAKRVGKPHPEQFENTLRGTLAYNIRLLRFENGFSQEELAFRCELDRTYISAVERCVWNIALENIEKIARALDVEPWRLLVPPRRVDS